MSYRHKIPPTCCDLFAVPIWLKTSNIEALGFREQVSVCGTKHQIVYYVA
jgi:hypothetical protein